MNDPAKLETPESVAATAMVRDRATFIVGIIGWCVTVAVALYSSWSSRFSLNPDGLSYLDIAQNYLHGNWSSAVNAYWSPLYSWIIAATFRLLSPSSYWELPTVQLINFAIFLLAFLSFELFWRAADKHRLRLADPDSVVLPRWAWMALGYALFLWTITNATLVSEVTPDLLVAAIVYFLAAILLRMRSGDNGITLFALFGAVLGVSYFGKTAMFVLAFPFLLTSFFTVKNRRSALVRVAVAGFFFLLLSVPFISLISRAKGRFTIGESGRVGYAWVVNRAGPFLNWQGTDPEGDIGLHPTRRLLSAPVLYEFSTPIAGTYPPHYDPSYWNEGMKPHFHVLPQIRVIFTSAYSIYTSIVAPQSGLLAAAFLALLLGGFLSLKRLAGQWHLLLPVVAAFGLYALVTVEARYLAGFIVMFWAAVFSAIQLPSASWSRRFLLGLTIASVLTLSLSAFEKVSVRAYARSGPIVNGDWQIARGLQQLGVHEGDKVITLGSAYNAYWAHLGRFKVVAEVPNPELESFWGGGASVLGEVAAIADRLQAKGIVASSIPKRAPTSGWLKIGDTGFYLYPVSPSRPPQ